MTNSEWPILVTTRCFSPDTPSYQRKDESLLCPAVPPLAPRFPSRNSNRIATDEPSLRAHAELARKRTESDIARNSNERPWALTARSVVARRG